MPTYVYRREDGTTFETQQRITEEPLETCPETGQPVERLISGSAGLIFKGEGFYINDYARKGNGRAADAKTPSSESGEATSEKKASGKEAASTSTTDAKSA